MSGQFDTNHPARDFTGVTPFVVTITAVVLPLSWLTSFPVWPDASIWALRGSLAAALTGLISAFLWLLAALPPNIQASNAAAAAFSGATALFSAGTVSFPPNVYTAAEDRWIAAWWPIITYFLAYSVVVLISVIAIIAWWRHRQPTKARAPQ